MPFNYTELEYRRLFRLYITTSIKRDEQKELIFFPKISSTIGDFLEEIKQWIPIFSLENNILNLRLTELILSNQNNIPFELRICSEQRPLHDFQNFTNHFYHLEEVFPDDSDHNKDMVLIPVAFYTKVIDFKCLFLEYSDFYI